MSTKRTQEEMDYDLEHGSKVCGHCKKRKKFKSFNIDKNKYDGYTTCCSECSRYIHKKNTKELVKKAINVLSKHKAGKDKLIYMSGSEVNSYLYPIQRVLSYDDHYVTNTYGDLKIYHKNKCPTIMYGFTVLQWNLLIKNIYISIKGRKAAFKRFDRFLLNKAYDKQLEEQQKEKESVKPKPKTNPKPKKKATSEAKPEKPKTKPVKTFEQDYKELALNYAMTKTDYDTLKNCYASLEDDKKRLEKSYEMISSDVRFYRNAFLDSKRFSTAFAISISAIVVFVMVYAFFVMVVAK